MDNQDFVADGGGEAANEGWSYYLFRFVFTVFFSLTASFVVSLLFGLAAVLFGAFSNSRAVSIPTECRIVSTGVDLRSSKVCELGVSNYKAKNVFYSSDKARVRCHDDYYWTSVFKVEYRDYFSGRTIHAIAEAPKEALPLDCRPSFGTAWLTKSMFKVNETYKCRYTPGIQKADIYSDDLFNCQAKDPSNMEMIRRLFILSLDAFLLDSGKGAWTMIDNIGGTMYGILISVCLIITLKIADAFKLSLARMWEAWKHHITILASHLRRAFLLAAYVYVMGWLTLQYNKKRHWSQAIVVQQ